MKINNKSYPKILYLVQVNYAGIHPVYKVYRTVNQYKKQIQYWDQSQNIVYIPEEKNSSGCMQLVFKTEEEAIAALKGMQLVSSFLKKLL